MLISIDKEHVEKAVTDLKSEAGCKSLHCPVAQGLMDIFPGRKIVVGFSNVIIGPLSLDLPPEATEKIHQFDDTGKVEPFEFELQHPGF